MDNSMNWHEPTHPPDVLCIVVVFRWFFFNHVELLPRKKLPASQPGGQPPKLVCPNQHEEEEASPALLDLAWGMWK